MKVRLIFAWYTLNYISKLSLFQYAYISKQPLENVRKGPIYIYLVLLLIVLLTGNEKEHNPAEIILV